MSDKDVLDDLPVGILSKYADPKKRLLEEGAFERAMVEKKEGIMENNKVFAMKFSKIYPLLVQKAERKNRTKQEVDEVIFWLTGYDEKGLGQQLKNDVDYETFFKQAPCMNPNRSLIKGTVCGVRVETIEDPMMRNIRCLDKLIDELAKGKAIEKILRK